MWRDDVVVVAVVVPPPRSPPTTRIPFLDCSNTEKEALLMLLLLLMWGESLMKELKLSSCEIELWSVMSAVGPVAILSDTDGLLAAVY